MSNKNGIHHKAEQHPRWKGDNASYSAIHSGLRSNFPKAGICEHCDEEKKTHYALKRGKQYTRQRSDYLELCAKCHRVYDDIAGKMTGRKFSKETLAKMSASAKKRANSKKGKAHLIAASVKGREAARLGTIFHHATHSAVKDASGKFKSGAHRRTILPDHGTDLDTRTMYTGEVLKKPKSHG